LFATLIGYSVSRAPAELWHLQPVWLLATILFIGLMLLLELAQFFAFLRHHHRPWHKDLLTPLRITTRKSILNATLPAQSGTLLLLRMVTHSYRLEWHKYLRFMGVATIIMLFVSLLAAASLVLPFSGLFVLLACSMGIALWLRRSNEKSYFRKSFFLLLTGSGIYLCRVFIFWTILQATDTSVTFADASYFAVITNTLAQFPITPGNVGVREALFGVVSPYLMLPRSVGVLIGGIFQVLRITVYSFIMLAGDFICNRRRRISQLSQPTEYVSTD
jgi:hypothetical protein